MWETYTFLPETAGECFDYSETHLKFGQWNWKIWKWIWKTHLLFGNGNRNFPRNSASFSTKSTHLERPRRALPGAGRLPNSSLRPHLAASAMWCSKIPRGSMETWNILKPSHFRCIYSLLNGQPVRFWWAGPTLGLDTERLNNSTPATEFGLGTAGKICICTSKPNIQSQTWPFALCPGHWSCNWPILSCARPSLSSEQCFRILGRSMTCKSWDKRINQLLTGAVAQILLGISCNHWYWLGFRKRRRPEDVA